MSKINATLCYFENGKSHTSKMALQVEEITGKGVQAAVNKKLCAYSDDKERYSLVSHEELSHPTSLTHQVTLSFTNTLRGQEIGGGFLTVYFTVKAEK